MKINQKLSSVLIIFMISVFIFAPYIQATNSIYKGIDVSHYQGNIDFDEVKNDGIEAVYIKVGEGDSYVDSKFEKNYKAAIDANLDFGFYYYVTATTIEDAKTQAIKFASIIQDISYTLKPAMDFEEFDELSKEERNDIAIAFLEKLEKITGVTPVVYSDAYNVEILWSES